MNTRSKVVIFVQNQPFEIGFRIQIFPWVILLSRLPNLFEWEWNFQHFGWIIAHFCLIFSFFVTKNCIFFFAISLLVFAKIQFISCFTLECYHKNYHFHQTEFKPLVPKIGSLYHFLGDNELTEFLINIPNVYPKKEFRIDLFSKGYLLSKIYYFIGKTFGQKDYIGSLLPIN